MKLKNNLILLSLFGILLSISLVSANTGTIIIDDGQVGYSDTGWNIATGQGYSNQVHWKNRNGIGYAVWTTNSPGIHDVYLSWTIDSNRPTNARYTVYYDGGQYNFTIDQTKNVNGTTVPSSEWPYWSGWKYIGTFNFASGNVTLWDNANDGKILIADAVKFISQPCTLFNAMKLNNCYDGYYRTHWCFVNQLKYSQSCTKYCCGLISGTCSGGVCSASTATTSTSTTTIPTTTTIPATCTNAYALSLNGCYNGYLVNYFCSGINLKNTTSCFSYCCGLIGGTCSNGICYTGPIPTTTITTTTTTLPCTENWLDNYQCVGDWRERQKQLTNCIIVWDYWEYCQYGCENGQCRTSLPTDALQIIYSDGGSYLKFSDYKLYSIVYADNNVNITNIGSSTPIFLYVCGENFPGIASFVPQMGTISLGWKYLPACDSSQPHYNGLRISYALGFNKGVLLHIPKIFYTEPWSQGTLHFEYDIV